MAVGDHRVLTADEVIKLLRIDQSAPRNPREALRRLVRLGQLECLRVGPGGRGRMVFLPRHVDDCLLRWQGAARIAAARRNSDTKQRTDV